MPALPPITTTVWPSSCGSRSAAMLGVGVVMVPPVGAVRYTLPHRSHARAFSGKREAASASPLLLSESGPIGAGCRSWVGHGRRAAFSLHIDGAPACVAVDCCSDVRAWGHRDDSVVPERRGRRSAGGMARAISACRSG
jgi:hypothetical protein